MDDNAFFAIDTTEHVGNGNPVATSDVRRLLRQPNGADRGASEHHMVYFNALLV